MKKLNGMFAIAIYDKLKKKFFLIRDRVGIKPLFFFNYNSTIFFSSEINSLISVPFFKKKLILKQYHLIFLIDIQLKMKKIFLRVLKLLPVHILNLKVISILKKLYTGKYLFLILQIKKMKDIILIS